MAEKLRVGAIGLEDSYWNWCHARFFKRMADVEFVALAHPTTDETYLREVCNCSLDGYAETFGVRLYKDPSEMIKQEGLNAVCIAARYSRQAELVELAAAQGAHVYVGKPMATNVADAKRILKAAEDSKVFVSSGMTERSDSSIKAAYEKLKSGAIGEPLSIRAVHNHGNMRKMPPKNWYMNPSEGGPALSLGWYVCDIVRWFAGAEADRVFAEYDNFLTTNAPHFIDSGKILARFSNRVMASCDIYYTIEMEWGFPTWEIEVVGTEGALRTTQVAFQTHLFVKDGPREFSRTQNELHFDELRAWATMCLTGEQSPYLPTAKEAYDAMELCLAARESAERHQPIELASFRA